MVDLRETDWTTWTVNTFTSRGNDTTARFVEKLNCEKLSFVDTIRDFWDYVGMIDEHSVVGFGVLDSKGDPKRIVDKRVIYCLKETVWVNDRLIDDYIFHLERTHPRKEFKMFDFVDVSWMLNYDSTGSHRESKFHHFDNVDFNQLSTMFFPINTDNSHWMLIVVDVNDLAIDLVDSLSMTEQRRTTTLSIMQTLENFMVDLFKDKCKKETKWTLREMECVKQENGNDCGVFMLESLESLFLNKEFTHQQSDIPHIRFKLAATFLNWVYFNSSQPKSTVISDSTSTSSTTKLLKSTKVSRSVGKILATISSLSNDRNYFAINILQKPLKDMLMASQKLTWTVVGRVRHCLLPDNLIPISLMDLLQALRLTYPEKHDVITSLWKCDDIEAMTTPNFECSAHSQHILVALGKGAYVSMNGSEFHVNNVFRLGKNSKYCLKIVGACSILMIKVY